MSFFATGYVICWFVLVFIFYCNWADDFKYATSVAECARMIAIIVVATTILSFVWPFWLTSFFVAGVKSCCPRADGSFGR